MNNQVKAKLLMKKAKIHQYRDKNGYLVKRKVNTKTSPNYIGTSIDIEGVKVKNPDLLAYLRLDHSYLEGLKDVIKFVNKYGNATAIDIEGTEEVYYSLVIKMDMTAKEASTFSDKIIKFILEHKNKKVQDLFFTLKFKEDVRS